MRLWTLVLTATVVTAGPARAQTSASSHTATPPAPSGPVASYLKLPLQFEANRGQTDKRVRFISRGPGYTLFLTSEKAVLVLAPVAKQGAPAKHLRARAAALPKTPAVVRLELTGANSHPTVTEEDPLAVKTNYLIGNDPNKWRTEIPNFAKVQYREVYPGIDLIYYGNQGRLEHDFVVAPGADPGRITLDLRGVSKLRIDGGDLVMSTTQGELRLLKPEIYQPWEGSRHSVPGGYVLKGGNRVGFEVPKFDRQRPLVIDPVLIYSTYLGGSATDMGFGIAVDSSGNAYITGDTTSTNFPTQNAFQGSLAGTQNVFVTKLAADGSSLVYSTYLGGGGKDEGYGIAVDSSGNAYVTGQTNSTNFPTQNALQGTYGGGTYDAFVTKLAADGSSLVYSTYLGGSDEDGGIGIAVDSGGEAYVTGGTSSTNFPTQNAFQKNYGGTSTTSKNAFVTKLAADGSSLVYSTYLGGSTEDVGFGIAVDSSGNAYVTGTTESTNFPTTANAFQGSFAGTMGNEFITKLAADGSSLVYSTYLGGSEGETGGEEEAGIAVDSSGNAYVTSETTSTNFPTTANAFQSSLAGTANVFVTKLAADGSSLVYSTYLGGSGDDVGTGLALDSSGDAYVTGFTSSANFPTQNAFQGSLAGALSAFVTELAADGSSLVYSTYLGGSGRDGAIGIALDSSGNAYVTGVTRSTNFPTTANAFQDGLAGTGNAFVVKIPAYSNLTSQTITVTEAAPANAMYNTTFNVAATASSGLPVSVSGSGVCSDSGTSTSGSAIAITMTSGTGTCTVTYNQAGDSTYAAAAQVTNTTAATTASQTITVTEAAPTSAVTDSTFNVAATASSGLPVSVSGSGACSGSGTSTGGSPVTITMTAPTGTCTVTYSQAGNSNYAAAPQVTNTTSAAAAAPSASLTTAVAFPNTTAGTTSAAMYATLSNSGSATLNISSIAIVGANPGDFAITTGTNACGGSLSTGSSCFIYVTFMPASAASYTATLQVTDNASGSPQTATLSGTGTPAPSFTISSSTPLQTVQPGSAASYTISATAQNGSFSNSVTLSASGLPSAATATFTPGSITPGSSSASSTLSIQTTAATAQNKLNSAWPTATPALALISLLFLPGKRRRRSILMSLLVFASLGAFAGLTACGGGFSYLPPAQTYTITVTGTSGADVQSTTVQLTVQ